MLKDYSKTNKQNYNTTTNNTQTHLDPDSNLHPVIMGCFQSKEKYTPPMMGPRIAHGPGRYGDQPQGHKPRYYNPYTGSEHGSDGSATWESYPGEFLKENRPGRVVIRQQ
ncbi:hypothetical protein CEP53_009354 [Fusarium sp. AF-6]|nr:hypothetical protein CEP53_009354 [Fusarium sp. AF-6]